MVMGVYKKSLGAHLNYLPSDTEPGDGCESARQVQFKRKTQRGPESNLPTSWQNMIIFLHYHPTTRDENFIIMELSQALPKVGEDMDLCFSLL